jgi:hypothetical protein
MAAFIATPLVIWWRRRRPRTYRWSKISSRIKNSAFRISHISAHPDTASTASTLLLHSQEFHTSHWGHLGLLNLNNNIILPGYAGCPNAAAPSLFPPNGNVADMAHAQQGLVGYVHPYESVPDPAKDSSLNHALPVDLALGKVDYIDIVGFADHKSTAGVWYRLLDCGFHLPTAVATNGPLLGFTLDRKEPGDTVRLARSNFPRGCVPWFPSITWN